MFSWNRFVQESPSMQCYLIVSANDGSVPGPSTQLKPLRWSIEPTCVKLMWREKYSASGQRRVGFRESCFDAAYRSAVHWSNVNPMHAERTEWKAMRSSRQQWRWRWRPYLKCLWSARTETWRDKRMNCLFDRPAATPRPKIIMSGSQG